MPVDATTPPGTDAAVAAANLLGGQSTLRRPVGSTLDAHELILEGLPSRALVHLLDRLQVLDRRTSLEGALGMSLRTFQRKKDAAVVRLSREQSGRAWVFAEILARTTALLGSQSEAERWLETPALALDGRRPLDLLTTPAGVELVGDLLTRLEYGVYT